MSRKQFFEQLNERLNAVKQEGFDVSLMQENPWSGSVSIGKEGAEPLVIDFSMFAHAANGYELGFDTGIFQETMLWAELMDGVRKGSFDEDLFCDAASFAFEKLIKGANEETVSRRDAYLALKVGEFAAFNAAGIEEFAAAQLVAEALSAQACGGWQTIDGEISTEKLVVFKDDERILVDMAPCDLSPLMAPAPVGTGM